MSPGNLEASGIGRPHDQIDAGSILRKRRAIPNHRDSAMHEYEVLHGANRRRPDFNNRALVRAASQASTASDKRAAETDARLKRLCDAIENGIADCYSACKIDPPYCLIYECYPDGAIDGDDVTSTDRLNLAAFQARSTAGAVGGSGPP